MHAQSKGLVINYGETGLQNGKTPLCFLYQYVRLPDVADDVADRSLHRHLVRPALSEGTPTATSAALELSCGPDHLLKYKKQ